MVPFVLHDLPLRDLPLVIVGGAGMMLALGAPGLTFDSVWAVFEYGAENALGATERRDVAAVYVGTVATYGGLVGFLGFMANARELIGAASYVLVLVVSLSLFLPGPLLALRSESPIVRSVIWVVYVFVLLQLASSIFLLSWFMGLPDATGYM